MIPGRYRGFSWSRVDPSDELRVPAPQHHVGVLAAQMRRTSFPTIRHRSRPAGSRQRSESGLRARPVAYAAPCEPSSASSFPSERSRSGTPACPPHSTSDARAALARAPRRPVVRPPARAPVVVVTCAPEVERVGARARRSVVADPGSLDAAAAPASPHSRAPVCRESSSPTPTFRSPDVRVQSRTTPTGPIAVLVPCQRDDGTPVLSVPDRTPDRVRVRPGFVPPSRRGGARAPVWRSASSVIRASASTSTPSTTSRALADARPGVLADAAAAIVTPLTPTVDLPTPGTRSRSARIPTTSSSDAARRWRSGARPAARSRCSCSPTARRARGTRTPIPRELANDRVNEQVAAAPSARCREDPPRRAHRR